jgi:hypothetical protein
LSIDDAGALAEAADTVCVYWRAKSAMIGLSSSGRLRARYR